MFVPIYAEKINEKNGYVSLKISREGKSCVYREFTRDEQKAEKLVIMINNGNVSLLHIDEILEDFLP